MSTVLQQIKDTHRAATSLRAATPAQTAKLLQRMAALLLQNSAALLRANKKDVALQDAADPRTDRLLLSEERVANMAAALRQVAALPCPAGRVLEKRKLPNGLLLQKWAVPLGVVGAIYESRPNVTFDIAALCLRSGNACVLKGSREADHTNKAALKIIKAALQESGIDHRCVTLLPPERAVVQELLTATRYVDVIIPRGSEGLIRYVREASLVPVIETGAGVCHIYVEQEADLEKAVRIAVNAKTSRPSVCNAADTVLVDAAVARPFLTRLSKQFAAQQVEIFADAAALKILKDYPFLQKAAPEDYGREFLSLKCAVKVVKGMDEALAHIARHSTRHSEAIVSENKDRCRRFLHEVDAAAVYANASTRFTDGGEFGLGAEIGISTQKLHARGPFALEKLVTEKWVVTGNGQVR